MVRGVEGFGVMTATDGSVLRADGLTSLRSSLPANVFEAGRLRPRNGGICRLGNGMGSAGGEPPGQPGQITAALAFGFALGFCGLDPRLPGLGLRPGLRCFWSFLFGSRPREGD